jgi:hypothetical protein
MAYASQAGRARISSKKPQAQAVCDRCGIWYNRVDLHWQTDWRGTSLQNLWLLVCRRCLDIPQEQLRAIQLPADPVPVWQPRVENFEQDETDYRSTLPTQPPEQVLGTQSGLVLGTQAGQRLGPQSGARVYPVTKVDPVTGIPIPSTTLRVTQDCENRITQPRGDPGGLAQNAIMPYNGGVQKAFGVPLSILSVIANGTDTIAVTCSKVHGLQTDSQVSIEALTVAAADGFFSVTVLTATAFTYRCRADVPSGSLLTPTTRIVTALVGLPYGSKTIPPTHFIGQASSRTPPPAPVVLGTQSGDILGTQSGEEIGPQ